MTTKKGSKKKKSKKNAKTKKVKNFKAPPVYIGYPRLILDMWQNTFNTSTSGMLVSVCNMIAKYHIPNKPKARQKIIEALRDPWDNPQEYGKFEHSFDWLSLEDKRSKKYIALEKAFKKVGAEMPEIPSLDEDVDEAA